MNAAAHRSARRQGLLVASVAVAIFMARLDISIVNISLPSIARSFHAGTSPVAWVAMGYLLFSCGCMLVVGRVADDAGPRLLFVLGYAVFTVASLFCGLAGSLAMLIAFRCLQGIGGAVLVILAYTVVARYLPAARVGGAMGLLATSGALGIALGSPLGGFLTEQFSWRWVFFVNVPVGVVAVVLAWHAMSGLSSGQGAREGSPARLDYAGAVLSFVAVASLVAALSFGEEAGWASAPIVALFALCAVTGVLFVVRQSRAADPLVAPSLLRDRRFLLAVATTVCGCILIGGNGFLMPFYLELVHGLDPGQAGLVLLVYSAVFIALSPFTGRLADRHAPWRSCAAGMGVGTVACAVFAFTLGGAGLVAAVAFLAAMALAYALFFAANGKEVLGAAPAEHKGAASAVFGTLYTLSLLVGVDLFETVYAQATSGEAAAASPVAGGWQPGFSGAYVAGAVACGLAVLLSLATARLGRRSELTAAPELR